MLFDPMTGDLLHSAAELVPPDQRQSRLRDRARVEERDVYAAILFVLGCFGIAAGRGSLRRREPKAQAARSRRRLAIVGERLG